MALYLCNSSLQILIKKGRGLWPAEALATHTIFLCEGANSIPINFGADKSGSSLQHILNNISPSDLSSDGLFYALDKYK